MLLSFTIVRPVAAHGAGVLQVSSAPAGPYELTVWTSPDPAHVGKLHVSTAVVFASDATPALEENVIVRLTPMAGNNPILVQTATTARSANKFLYETDFSVKDAGRYEVTVGVLDAAGVGGEVSFEIPVQTAAGPGWPLFLLLSVGIVGVAWFLRAQTSPKFRQKR